MSLCINIIKLFIKTNDKLILFNSYAGRKYDDSPKVLFEAIKNDARFKDYTLVWAFHEPEKFNIDGAKKIKTDNFNYFKTALAARVWITNSSIERGLSFKGKRTFYLNTWHGTPIKLMGFDINQSNTSFRSKSRSVVDIMTTQSYFETLIFSRCFGIPRKNFIEVGLPRNDELANYAEEYRKKLRKKLNIPNDKQAILYCPTFREYEKDENLGVIMTPPINLKKWEEKLKSKYILLFRAHYEVSEVMKIEEDDFVRNMTNYHSLNELMIASDILLSDYSSIFFDYSIMNKCMLHFTYDFEKYREKRGMYFDIRDYLNGANNEDELLTIFNNLNYQEEITKTRSFREQYVQFYGNATQKTVNCIAKHVIEGMEECALCEQL